VRNFLFFKSVQCFVKKDKTSLIFLGHLVLFVQKFWDGLSAPKGYFVLGTFCPKDRSVAGTFQPGTFQPGTFQPGALRPRALRPGTFRQGTNLSYFLTVLCFFKLM
jgi:hypothetical protein